jgi:hypothetical protein
MKVYSTFRKKDKENKTNYKKKTITVCRQAYCPVRESVVK